MCSGIITSG
ncbi:hypothetical protein VCHC50A1_2725, partial [Vibrio cholerae HC-50A1]